MNLLRGLPYISINFCLISSMSIYRPQWCSSIILILLTNTARHRGLWNIMHCLGRTLCWFDKYYNNLLSHNSRHSFKVLVVYIGQCAYPKSFLCLTSGLLLGYITGVFMDYCAFIMIACKRTLWQSWIKAWIVYRYGTVDIASYNVASYNGVTILSFAWKSK